MARPRKGTEEVWYDTFAEWSEEDRAAALKVLEHLHRALTRAKKTDKTEPDQPSLLEDSK